MKKFVLIFVNFLFTTSLSLTVMSSDLPIVAVSQFESTVGNDRYYKTKYRINTLSTCVWHDFYRYD